MHPRWPPPWTQSPARPAFVPPLPPPPRGFLGPHRFFPRPPTGFYPRFVPPPRPPAVDAEQLWLDSFKRTHCSSINSSKHVANECDEPPLRMLRCRVLKAQKLVEQLKSAAAELAAVEKRLETLSASTEQLGGAALSVEVPRLRVQRERKVAVCEALKKQLDVMNAASGLFPEKQFVEIRAFAARVNKKKVYRKRAKLQRRAEASIRRAVNSNAFEKVEPVDAGKMERNTTGESVEDKEESDKKEDPSPPPQSNAAAYLAPPDRKSSKRSLDPETLTIDTLIELRRAWDSYIVFPQTPGASTIPAHFVPPPPAPSAEWEVYVASSLGSGTAR